MTDCEQAVRSFRFRLGSVLLLRYGLAAMTGWAILWGTAVLIARAGFGVDVSHLLWGLAGFPLMLLPAAYFMMKRLPSANAIRALIDHQGQAGGLVVAAAEVPLGSWQLPRQHTPEIRWQGGKTWAQFFAAGAYALFGFLVPQAAFQQLQGSTFHIDREVEQLNKQIDVLKENAVLEPERAQQMKDKLNQVKDEAKANDPAKTLEALDHLQDTAKQEAAKAAEKAAQKNDRLRKAKTLAEAIDKAGSDLDPKVLAMAMKELNSIVDALQKENQLSRPLDENLAKALKESKLTPEQLDKLAKALKDSKGDVAKLLENLKDAKLITEEMLKECKGCKEGGDGEGNADELAKYLKECNGDGDKDGQGLKAALGKCAGNRPGRGGLTRGRGDAELTFGDEAKKDGVKFKEEILPPASLQALKDSQLSGLSTSAPKVDPGGSSTAGALDGSQTGGGSANTQVILPRHRDAVQKYFERKDKSQK